VEVGLNAYMYSDRDDPETLVAKGKMKGLFEWSPPNYSWIS
jgi:hypothetical protein